MFIACHLSSTDDGYTNCNHCGESPKYLEAFDLPDGIIGYNNYEQALACAEFLDKPLMVYFTAYACVNCRKMEENILNHPTVVKKINHNFVFVALFVDDRTRLPESDWFYHTPFYSKRRKHIKTIGSLNLTSLSQYLHGAQPAIFIDKLDNKEEKQYNYISYTPKISTFVAEIDSILQNL